MAMTAGTVTIADDGTVSGAGAARTMFDAYAATLAPLLSTLTTAQKVGVYRSAADLINSIATMITYIKANGVAHIPIAVASVQAAPPIPASVATSIDGTIQ